VEKEMEVSRLSIGQETISRINSMAKLGKTRKSQIRFEGIKELIKTHPKGHLFSIKELGSAAGYRVHEQRGYWAAVGFINSLKKNGKLVKLSGKGKNKSAYLISENTSEVVKNIVEGNISDVKSATNIDFQQVKRGRGRPRKSIEVLFVPEDEEINFIDEEELAAEIEKANREKEQEEAAIVEKQILADQELLELTKSNEVEGPEFSFEFHISRRADDGEFGRKTVSQLSMYDVDVATIEHMTKQIIDRIK
jgi:hypothetical protein